MIVVVGTRPYPKGSVEWWIAYGEIWFKSRIMKFNLANSVWLPPLMAGNLGNWRLGIGCKYADKYPDKATRL